jgi:hypothetical protein
VDARSINPQLYAAARETVTTMIANLAEIIRKGIHYGQLNPAIDPQMTAQNLYAIIEGGIFLAFLNEDETYLQNVLNVADNLIQSLQKT